MSKEKQIEEIAKLMCGMVSGCNGCMFSKETCYERKDAEDIYNAGYRKQSKGEWILEHETYGKMICSNCKEEALKDDFGDYVDSDFCPHCGAEMTGGAE